MYYPCQPAPMPEDVSPLEASRDRQYLLALLSGRVTPGLRLAATRIDTAERATRPLPQTQDLSEASHLRARA